MPGIGGDIASVANGANGDTYGVQINDVASPSFEIGGWTGNSATDNAASLTAFVGTVRTIFIQLLQGSAGGGNVVFLCGKNCDLGFAGAVLNAGG